VIHQRLAARGSGLALVAVLGLALAVTGAVRAGGSSTPLVDAVKAGDRPAVRRLLQRHVDVKEPETDGTTALHWAVRADDREMAKLLLEGGAKPDAINRYGVAPLQLAATNGNAAMVRVLLDAGARPDTANPGGETVLMTAARAGSVETVQLLASRGADVNAREMWFGENGLMWAAAENHAGVVRALVKLGAQVNARSRVVAAPELEFPKSGGPNMPFARGGWTALMHASREGAIDAARVLVELGADPNLVALPQTTDVALTDEIKHVGTSALVYAIINAHFDLAAMLLEHGANPNIADHTGMAALYAAVEWNTLQWVQSRPAPIWRDRLDGTALIERLLARGADPNAMLDKTPPKISLDPGATLNFGKGATPLMRAARTNDVGAMRALLDWGADAWATLPDGTTVLMIAAGRGLGPPRGDGPRIRVPTEEGALQAVKLLLDWGLPINAANAAGDTALHASISRGDRVVKLLAERGADLQAKNKAGLTALDIALGAGGRGRRGGGGPGGVVRESTAALLRQLMESSTLKAESAK
jgi:ankyrin repeat protein